MFSFQFNRWEGFERYSMTDMSGFCLMSAPAAWSPQSSFSFLRYCRSKKPMYVQKAPLSNTSPMSEFSCSWKPDEDADQRIFSDARSPNNCLDLAHFCSTDCISFLIRVTALINCAYSSLYFVILFSMALIDSVCRSNSSWFASASFSIAAISILKGSIDFKMLANFNCALTQIATGPAHFEARLILSGSHSGLLVKSLTMRSLVESFKSSELKSRID
mmetsp:Transcript_54462/g.86582  ORF Transcript_54462/g.86582 Transcript_54462/m.86582 type:complete len:218 (+) Transcript_54462:235-888(+)